MSQDLLLIVDVQNGFIGNQATKAVVPKIVKLVNKFGPENCVASRFINPPGGNWEKLMDWRNMQSGQDTELAPELTKLNMLSIDKNTYSAWGDELSGILAARQPENVYICGIDTDQCVLMTAGDVFSHGYRPVVITDCCASSAGDDFHQAGLKLLKRLIGADQLIESKEIPT